MDRFILDLTGLKRSQKELRESEAKFRGFVEAAAEGILEIDSENRITYANGRVAELFGYPVPDLEGKSVFQLIDQKYGAVVRAQLEHRRQGISRQMKSSAAARMEQRYGVSLAPPAIRRKRMLFRSDRSVLRSH